MMSGKAMLGVEGGASIFDFDGSIAGAVEDYQKCNPEADFDQIWMENCQGFEGNVVHKTITPRLFEAIATKTALILYPGRYRDILVPNRHYIPLEQDGSNIEEVVARLNDDEYLQNMVDRTYREILYRDDLSERFYMKKIDNVLASASIKKQDIKRKRTERDKDCIR